jgi:hypothetical protein
MAGALTISTLNNDTGVLATQNGMTGIAKAWVNFVGGTGAITGSFNVSSVTRSATGTYQVNFTTAMPDANYAVAGSANDNAGIVTTFGGTYSTTTSRILVATSTNGAAADFSRICAIYLGN